MPGGDGADPHAFETLGDTFLEKADRGAGAGEKIRIDHHVAGLPIVLVDDIGQRLLKAIDTKIHGPGDAALAIVERFFDAPALPDRAIQTSAFVRGASGQTRSFPDRLIGSDTHGMGTDVLLQHGVWHKVSRSDSSRIVQQAIARVKDYIGGKGPGSETGQHRGQHHAERWLMA